ncbi:MaoC/PaaZ C-terminal domain-containing protein [Catenuloplanes indicus]|uniref:Acyl dehydratase n=1 Tax=Catenuloplanes indicus TaxID=137267 RepID=A0AAE3W3A7_9ACTN|nr:MaoC/PaaZ C-terminal domain-containing protein [Catenuloplanes indicus]MDQ0367919.1 acyl dehydratase [Catenuloplanes indicus]
MSVYLRAALGLLPLGTRPDRLPSHTLTRKNLAVDRARLARYDRVCGFRLGDALPPTYPHVLAFDLVMELMTARAFPFPVVGLLHVTNRIEVLRPLTADDRLDLAVHAVDLRDHPRGRQFDIDVTVTVDGEVAWRSRSAYLRRERASGTPRADRPDLPAPSARWRLTPAIGPEYAAVSGDHNPIHLSWLGARAFGFPGPITHGMWTLARALAALEGRLPVTGVIEAEFRRPVPLPSVVDFGTDLHRLAVTEPGTGKPYLTARVGP